MLRLAAALRRCLPDDLSHTRPEELQPLQLKALVELFYVHDHYGNFPFAQQLVVLGPQLLDGLEQQKPFPPGRSQVDQSRVRLVVAYGVGCYRDHELEAAERILVRARRVLEDNIPPDLFLGTRGELAYALGRVYRQQQMFITATREFEKAISLYHRRVEQRKIHGKARSTDETFSRHKIAIIIGLAIGWCNYTQGRLSTAIATNLIPARTLLQSSNDELNAAYADVIYASACRARGSPWDSLGKLYHLVRNAIKVFTKYDHKHYISGAIIELALIELARQRHDKAQACLESPNTDLTHPRWLTWMNIIRSRIARANGDKTTALRFAENAFKIATKREERLGQIEALIAMSEVRTYHDDALTDLRRAKELNQQAEREGKVWSSNLKIDAVCCLHMAKHHLELEQRPRAAKCFADWQAVQDKVEHAPVRKMAEALAAKLTLQTPGKFEVDGLNFAANKDRMLLHLIDEAEAQEGRELPYRRLCELLGVAPSVIRRVRRARAKNDRAVVTKAHA